MCAILGCYRLSGKARPPVPVAELLARLRHRGPDDTGVHEAAGAVLAQARLSIIDVAGGHQPMSNEDGTLWITYNGEIYNFRELHNRLYGHQWKTQSDTEVVLHAYEEEGPECVKRFNGMFAFALLDGDDLFLARDPLGVKPLYTADRDGWLYFASEIKALVPLGVAIEEFPPGHWWHSDLGRQAYFDLTQWTSDAPAPAKPVQAVRKRLQLAVERRLVADVPVGVFLSGGLDSSVIAALMRQHVPDLRTYSVGMADSLDLPFAQQVANHLGTRHTARVLTPDEVRGALPKVIYHLESFDFALVRSALANWFVAETAARDLKVVLVGEGADELFGGYHYLKELDDAARARELLRITGALHNSNLQRVDRMTMAHGLEGREPFLDLDLIQTAFALSARQRTRDGVEKWILRKACEDLLPAEVVWRVKEKFSRGVGSALLFEEVAERDISDAEFARERQLPAGRQLRCKEELLYYREFRKHYPATVAGCLGFTAAAERR